MCRLLPDCCSESKYSNEKADKDREIAAHDASWTRKTKHKVRDRIVPKVSAAHSCSRTLCEQIWWRHLRL